MQSGFLCLCLPLHTQASQCDCYDSYTDSEKRVFSKLHCLAFANICKQFLCLFLSHFFIFFFYYPRTTAACNDFQVICEDCKLIITDETTIIHIRLRSSFYRLNKQNDIFREWKQKKEERRTHFCSSLKVLVISVRQFAAGIAWSMQNNL